MSRKRELILRIVETDTTFHREDVRGEETWVGKCLHCGRRLFVATDGEPISRATIEHILPSAHGGSDELTNLALACAGCNHEKGVRHDVRRKLDARGRHVIEALLARRRVRWRDPPPR